MNTKRKTRPEKEWTHSGLKCHITFQEECWRCGYVTIPKSHPCYNMGYDDIPIDVHGGLTFSNGEGCFGFDCAHAGDINSNEHDREGHFWTIDDVEKETNSIAEQFKKITVKDCFEHKLQWMPDWFKKHLLTLGVDAN